MSIYEDSLDLNRGCLRNIYKVEEMNISSSERINL